MTDELEPIGISLVLEDGFAESLRRLGRDMDVFNRRAEVATAQMNRITRLHFGAYRQAEPARAPTISAPLTPLTPPMQPAAVAPGSAPRPPVLTAAPDRRAPTPTVVAIADRSAVALPPVQRIVAPAPSPRAAAVSVPLASSSGERPTAPRPPPAGTVRRQPERPPPAVPQLPPGATRQTASATPATTVAPRATPPVEPLRERPKISVTLSSAPPTGAPLTRPPAGTAPPAPGPTARSERAGAAAPSPKVKDVPASVARLLPEPVALPLTPQPPLRPVTAGLPSRPAPPSVPPPSRAAPTRDQQAAPLPLPPAQTSAGPRSARPIPAAPTVSAPPSPNGRPATDAPATAATAPQAPGQQAPGQQAPGAPVQGDVMLDGISIGGWLSTMMAREAARPLTTARGFNTRIAPAWPGTPL